MRITPCLLALSFLTRIPVPDLGKLEAVDFGKAALCYPAVGLLLGGLLCLLPLLLPNAAPLLLAAILTVLWAILTGGLHLDGLADSADAWLGGYGDVEKTQRILKDPLLGAAGAIAITSVLLLKFAALVVILENGVWWAVLLAPPLGRSLILLLFLTTPYVRQGGLASAVTQHLPRQGAWVITLAALAAAMWFAPLASVLVLAGFWGLRRLMLQRLRGCTGDTAGATVEIGEMLWLLGVGLHCPVL